MFLRLIVAAAVSAMPLLAAAHEFWIDTEQWQVAPGDQLEANIRVGQNFKGGASAYFPPRIRRFDIVLNGMVSPVEGRAGDRPALNTIARADGLAVVVHATSDYHLTYKEWKKFEAFATSKDWAQLLDVHRARALPETDFKERYSRYGKSLISIGTGVGADTEVGLATEILALANPYTDDLAGNIPVRVLYQGAPRENAQVELFEKAPSGEVSVTFHKTDQQGNANLPVKPGHTYLADSVVIRAIEPSAGTEAVWESLWASLTFHVPVK